MEGLHVLKPSSEEMMLIVLLTCRCRLGISMKGCAVENLEGVTK